MRHSAAMSQMFVCFITKAFVTHHFSPTPAFASHVYVTSNYMFSITPESDTVNSSNSHMLGPGTPADSQTIPTAVTGVSESPLTVLMEI